MNEMVLRNEIMNQMHRADGPLSNIIYNMIQYEMEYNWATNKFQIEVSKAKTEYFRENPNEYNGIIEGTNVHWEYDMYNLIVWIE